MKILMKLVPLVSLLLASFSVSAAEPNVNCYLDACVGDHAVNIQRDYREVVIVGIDNFGKFVLQFEDGGVGGNWDRGDIALEHGCSGDLCVGYPLINITRDYRQVTVHAIQYNGKYVLRFNDTGGVGGNWDRWDLATPWGCVRDLCVNDIVYNRKNGLQARIAAIQMSPSGLQDRMVLDYGARGLGGNWEYDDVVLTSRGHPPSPPAPYCPPGSHWDPVRMACIRDYPPPPPPPPHAWECVISKPTGRFTGRGPTRGAAITASLRACAAGSGGYPCRATEAVCRPY